MKTESAKILNLFLNKALELYTNYCFKTMKDEQLSEMEKHHLSNNKFLTYFHMFLYELKENIRTYKDISLIRDYVLVSFPYLIDKEHFHEDENKWTIARGYEVQFLLNLKRDIAHYIDEIQACTKIETDLGCPTNTLKNYFEREKENNFDVVASKEIKTSGSITLFVSDIRFDFDQLKNECSTVLHNIEKIKIINERLFDFEQWQIQHDRLLSNDNNSEYYESTDLLYKNFKKLCTVELKRLDKLIEIEQRMPLQTETNSKYELIPEMHPYQWNANFIDLIELVAAMHESEALKRTDGKKQTQKALFEYFQVIFNIGLKNTSTNLTKAGNRKNGITPYLDKLKLAFENYVEEKEKKLEKRR